MPDPELKTLVVQLRLSAAEKDDLKKLAKKARMNQSAYLRFLINREAARL